MHYNNSTKTKSCGKLWNSAIIVLYLMRNCVDSKVDKPCTLVARQSKNGGGGRKPYMFLVELLVEALQGSVRGIIVLAEVAKHDVLDLRMIHLCKEASRLDIAQMPKRS